MSNQRGDGQTYQNKKNEKSYFKNQGKYNNNNFSNFEQPQKIVEPGSQQNQQSQNSMLNSQQMQNNKSQNSLLQNEYPKNIQSNPYQQFQGHLNSGKQSPATKYQPKDSQFNSQAQGQNNSAVKYMQKQKNSNVQEKNNNDQKQTKSELNINTSQQDLEILQNKNIKFDYIINENKDIIQDSKLNENSIESSGQRIVEEQLNFINSNNVKYNQQPVNNQNNKLNNASIKDFEEIEKAAKNGNDEELQNLFEKLNKQSKQLNKRQLIQALHATVEGCKSTTNVENHIACFNYLLSFSSDQEQTINGEKNNKLIIMIAAQKGFIELVNEIISKGAWINHVDSNSQNSLFYAIDNQQENQDVVEVLIHHKANINKMTTSEGYTPLMLAVKRGHKSIVKMLMDEGADIGIADFQNNNTALHIACELGEKEIVEILATEDTYDRIYNLSNKNDMKAIDIVEQKICFYQGQTVKDKKNLNIFYDIFEYLQNLKQKVDGKIGKNQDNIIQEEQKLYEEKQKKLLKKQTEKNEKIQTDIQKDTESIIVKDEKSEENLNQINQKKQKQKKQNISKNQLKQDHEYDQKNQQKQQKTEVKDQNHEKIAKNETLENEKKQIKIDIQQKQCIDDKQQEAQIKIIQNPNRNQKNQKIEKDHAVQENKEPTFKTEETINKDSISLEDFQQMFTNQTNEQKLGKNQQLTTMTNEIAQNCLQTQNIDQKTKQIEIDQNIMRDSINQSSQPIIFPQQVTQAFPPKNVFQYQNQTKADSIQPQSLHHLANESIQQSGQTQINNLHSQIQNQALNFNKQLSNGNKNKGKNNPQQNIQNSNIYNQQQIQSPQFQNYNFGSASLNNIQNSQQNLQHQNTNLQSDSVTQNFNNQQPQNQLGVTTQNVNIASNLQQQIDLNQLQGIQQQLALVSLMQNGMGGVNLNNLNLGFNQVLQPNQNIDHSQQNLLAQQMPVGQLPVKGVQYGTSINQILNNQNQNIEQNILQNQLLQSQIVQQRANNTPVNQIPSQNIIGQQNINPQHNINLSDLNNLQLQNTQQPFSQFQSQFNQPNQLIFTGLQNQQQINQNMLLGQLNIPNNNIQQHSQTQQQKTNIYNQQQLLNISNHLNNGQIQNNMILNNLQDIPQNITNTQHQNIFPISSQTNSQIILGAQSLPHTVQLQKQPLKLPIKVDLDLSDEKSLNLFIYKQKYNMKKNDYFNLEKRKTELEKEITSKDNEILRLKELNRKYQLYNSLKDQGLDDSINLQKLIFHHNKQVHLINHFKEKYEKSQQFCIDLLNKSNEAIKLIKQMQISSKGKELQKSEDNYRPALSNREVIDVSDPIRKVSGRQQEAYSPNDRPSEEQVNEIIESIQTFDELMEKTLEAKDSEEIIQKLNQNEVSLKIFNYDLVKNIIQKEHQASNILLMEKRYEIPLVKPQIPDIKKLLSAHAYALLLTQYPNFEEIHTRHNIQQIHNILHNEILLFKQDANAIMKEMAEVKQILILKVESIIKSCNSEYTIDVYGSHRTGLCMYWSDIDIVVNPISIVHPIEALSFINDRLEREKSTSNQWITNVNYKRKATVPVVTITCSLAALMKQENLFYPKNPCYESIYEKTISVDITCNNYSIDMHLGHRHLGIECVELVQQYVKDCWLIEPLLLVLKQLLKVNGLNEPFKGGMSSYGLLLMIVGFLQFRQYDIPCEPKHQNLGEILLDFLQFFSNFDFKNKQINCKRPDEYSQFNYIREVIQSKSLIDQIPFPYANESPTILDPLKNDSNVTKSTYQFREIQEIFKVAHQSASVGCYCNSHFSLSGIEAQNKHSQDLQNLEYLILSLVDDPSAQAGAVCQYLQSKQTGTPSLIQYQGVGNEQDNQIHMYVQNGEEKIVPIESLYKPVFVEHSHQCDSIIAKIIYSYAQIKAARENSIRIST